MNSTFLLSSHNVKNDPFLFRQRSFCHKIIVVKHIGFTFKLQSRRKSCFVNLAQCTLVIFGYPFPEPDLLLCYHRLLIQNGKNRFRFVSFGLFVMHRCNNTRIKFLLAKRHNNPLPNSRFFCKITGFVREQFWQRNGKYYVKKFCHRCKFKN